MKKLILSLLTISSIYAQDLQIGHFESAVKAFEERGKASPSPKGKIVLYGSSSFTNWGNSYTHLKPLETINRGFGGSWAAEANYYFDRVIMPLEPKTIFFYEGDNDLAGGFDVDSVFRDFLVFTQKVRKQLPETKIIFVSVKLCPARKHLFEKVKQLNAMVKGYTHSDRNLGFVDITPLQFLPDGRVDPSMFTADSLHISDSAYLKWAVRMKQTYNKLYPSKTEPENFVNIFNGKDLTGWEQRGGKAKYEVKDGMIVGTSVDGTPNSFMCTKKIYRDFVLEFEVKVDTILNSGVQFRSNSKPGYKDGVVHGYQCEIDPSKRRFSAGIYDEQRRGWLYKPEFDKKARMAFDQKGWNKYRIEAIGYSIKTYLNGVPVSDIVDLIEPSGFIGLQVHSISKPEIEAGKQVMWRNIRIAEK